MKMTEKIGRRHGTRQRGAFDFSTLAPFSERLFQFHQKKSEKGEGSLQVHICHEIDTLNTTMISFSSKTRIPNSFLLRRNERSNMKVGKENGKR